MNRKIAGFGQDQELHWFARLDCGHRQHVRHDPPLVSRPWVITQQGRDQFVGNELDCLRCDQFEWPDDDNLVWMKDSPIFDLGTIPPAIIKEHQTSVGVWGKIVVSEGSIGYCVLPPCERDFVLTPELAGVVLPHVKHRLVPSGPVKVQIRFFRVTDHLQGAEVTEDS